MRLTLALFSFLPTLAFVDVARADDVTPKTVQLTIAGDPQLAVERRIEQSELWETVCTGTCNTTLPREGEYRIAGAGIRPSEAISLFPRAKGMHLDVSPAYKSGWGGGVLFSILGPLVSIAGGIAIVVASNSHQEFEAPCPFPGPCNNEQPPQSNAGVIGGAILIGIGALMTAGGILALVFTDHTTVSERVAFSGRGMTVRF